MRDGSSRSTVATAVAVGLAVLLAVGLVVGWTLHGRTSARSRLADARPPTHIVTSPSPAPGTASDDSAGGEPWSNDPLAPFQDRAAAWASVDMEAIRAALPDNLYWKMAVPTKDPEVLRKREEERQRWNVEYGKVLSNTATDEEIDAYYAQRQRLSEDYLAFIVYLLTNYGYQLPLQDVAALKLAAEMHNARLEEIPRQTTEAHERHAAHDAARRAWLEQQKAFETKSSDGQ